MNKNIEDELDRIKRILEDHERRILKLEKTFESRYPRIVKRVSIREFLNSKKPRTGVDKTLAICYYLEKYENIVPFNKNDVEEAFKRAKEKTPANINDAIYKNIKKGFIMEVGKKEGLKAYQLTRSGEEYVENDFKHAK